MLDICLLGTGGMMPMPGRFLTSLAARLNGRMMLIDCGEGTQVTMKMQGWGFKNIDAICFTHFHAGSYLRASRSAADHWQCRQNGAFEVSRPSGAGLCGGRSAADCAGTAFPLGID